MTHTHASTSRPASSDSSATPRQAFTTSLSDFALPTLHPAATAAASNTLASRRLGSSSAAAATTTAPHATKDRDRNPGGYHLRPRSNLSRNVIVAGQEEAEDCDADDQSSDNQDTTSSSSNTQVRHQYNVAPRTTRPAPHPASHLHLTFSAASASPSTPGSSAFSSVSPRGSRMIMTSSPSPSSPSSSSSSAIAVAPGRKIKSRNIPLPPNATTLYHDEQEDTDALPPSRSSFRSSTSTSPQIARTINAGYAARMGSLPPLSPKAFKIPYPRDSSAKYTTSSPSPRLRRATGPSTAGSQYATSPDFSDLGGDDFDLDVDVELDLNGMDMRMDEGLDDRGAQRRSSSPPRRPNSYSSGMDAGRQADEEDNLQGDSSSSSPRKASQPKLPSASTSTSTSTSTSAAAAAGPLPPSLKRVLHSLRDESEPSYSEIASEAKLTRKLTSAQQQAVPSLPEKTSEPVTPSAPAAVGGSDYNDEEHFLDDVGFESDDPSTSDDGDHDQQPQEDFKEDSLMQDDQMDGQDGQEALTTSEPIGRIAQSSWHGLGIIESKTPPSRNLDLAPNSHSEGYFTTQHSQHSPFLSPTWPQHPPTFSTTPSALASLPPSPSPLSTSTDKRSTSSSLWTQFRNHSHKYQKHHHHHHHRNSASGGNKEDKKLYYFNQLSSSPGIQYRNTTTVAGRNASPVIAGTSNTGGMHTPSPSPLPLPNVELFDSPQHQQQNQGQQTVLGRKRKFDFY
ncbi:unnamed protein product [Sympodiomycopsis kandeliae]